MSRKTSAVGVVTSFTLLAVVCCNSPAPPAESVANTPASVATGVERPLRSWNEGPRRQAILDFVAKVSSTASPDFLPPAERIAVFDHDGTLWAEQPIYFQFQFAIDRVKALAPKHPEWQSKEPFASVLKGDISGVAADGDRALLAVIGATASDMTTEEYDQVVKDWIATAKHPETGRLFKDMAYLPMIELLQYFRANGFKTFIVSGGGTEFMRAFAEQVYGIPPEQVIGSTGKLRFEMRAGVPVLVKLPELDFVDDREGKPIGIQRVIGKRPIAAVGNSDGDLQMLQWSCAGAGPRFCLFVHHTDAEREFAYDRKSSVGRLDKGLDEAAAKGWTVVDMKTDWAQIFSPRP